jgi:hypothetical protein
MLRIPHFAHNRLTDGGEAAKPYAAAALYLQEGFWYSFQLTRTVDPMATLRLEELGQLKN